MDHKRYKRYMIIFSICSILSLNKVLRAENHFQKPVISPQVCDFLGTVSINGTPANPNDEIAFFDSTGTLCGSFVVQRSGLYGFLHVYGDDPATSADEGSFSGEQLYVKVWDANAHIEYQGDDIFLVPGDQSGSVFSSHLPPVWRPQVRYVLNIYASLKNDINLNQRVEISDAIMGMRFISKQETCNPPCLYIQDIHRILQILQQLTSNSF